jgi:hypothetical protein
MAIKVKNEVNAVLEASGDTICFPDRDAKIAEFACYKAESRGFEADMNWKTGSMQNRNIYCKDT